MKQFNWPLAAVFGGVVLLVFLVGVSLLGGGWGYGGWGMMGPGMMGPGMMGGWGGGPFGWLGALFMWLIPLGLIAVTAAGVVWLVRATGGGGSISSPSGRACPGCGRQVQADWSVCPYCGASLTEA